MLKSWFSFFEVGLYEILIQSVYYLQLMGVDMPPTWSNVLLWTAAKCILATVF